MNRRHRAPRAAALVGVIVALLLVPLPVASAHGRDHRQDGHGWSHRQHTRVHDVVARAVNRRDGRTRIDAETDLVRTHSRRVKAHVGAYAYSSCTDCRTAAVGVEVLVASRVSDLDVGSQAVAVNDNCVRCDTLAVAYQFTVASTSSQLHLQPGAARQLRRMERRLERAVERSDSNAEALATTDALAGEILALLQSSVWVEAPDTSDDAGAPHDTSTPDDAKARPDAGAPADAEAPAAEGLAAPTAASGLAPSAADSPQPVVTLHRSVDGRQA